MLFFMGTTFLVSDKLILFVFSKSNVGRYSHGRNFGNADQGILFMNCISILIYIGTTFFNSKFTPPHLL